MPAASGSPTQLKSSVSTVADLAGLPDEGFLDGDLAYVASTGATYQLHRGVAPAAIDDVNYVATFSSTGYWQLFATGDGTVTLSKIAPGVLHFDAPNVCSWGPAIQGREKSLAMTDLRVAAYAGDTIALLLERLLPGGTIYTYAQTAEPPVVSFTMIGTNSLFAGMDAATALAELDAVLAAMVDLLPDTYRVLCTIPKLYAPAAPVGGLAAVNAQIDLYNAGIMALADPVARISAIDVSAELPQSCFASDGVHLSSTGMAVIGEMVADEFERIFPAPAVSTYPNVARVAFFGDSNTSTGGGFSPGGYRPAFFSRLTNRSPAAIRVAKPAFACLTPTTDAVVVTDAGFELTAESCAVLLELRPTSYVAGTNAIAQCTPTGQNYSKGWLLSIDGTNKTINLYLQSLNAAVTAKFPDEMIGRPAWIMGHADRDAGVASIYAAWRAPSGDLMWGCLGQATGVTPWAAGDANGTLRVAKNESFPGVGGLYRRVEFSRGAQVPTVDEIAAYFREAIDGRPIPGISARLPLDEGTGTAPTTASGAVGTLTGGWSSTGIVEWPGEEIGGTPILSLEGVEWTFSDDARIIYAFDANNAGGITLATGAVSLWASSHGLCTGAQATPGKRPVYNATGINGRPSVDFDGVDDFLSLASFAAPLGDHIMVAVIDPTAGSFNTARWLLDVDTGRTIFAVNESSVGNRIAYYGGGWASSGVIATTGAQVLTMEFRSGVGTRFYKNGALIGSEAVSAVATALGGAAAALGSNNGGTSGFYSGKLGLFAVANGRVDDALRVRMERKAAALFGIPISN